MCSSDLMRRMDASGGWIGSTIDLMRFLIHIDQLAYTPSMLQPNNIEVTTTSSGIRVQYAKGWFVAKGNWAHGGILPGSTSVVARTHTGHYWAALANSNQRGGNIELHKLALQMLRSVKSWSA